MPSPSSTIGSFVRAFMLRRHWPSARIGMVALIPRRHSGNKRILLQGAAPDILFVPSYASLLHASDLSLNGLRNDFGVGVRFHGPRTTPLRIEFAYGNEGLNIVFGSSSAF